MSDTVPKSQVDDVGSSVRRFVGVSKTGRRGGDRLVLTPQLRVTQADVLVLRPENAVSPLPDGLEPNDPQLKKRGKKDHRGAAGNDVPLLLENALTKQRGARRTDVTELTAKIAALETAIAKTVDQWEPDGAGRDAYSGTEMPAIDWPCDVELDATGKTMKPPSDLVLKAVGSKKTTTTADPVVDEDMLRRIVTEVIREELQGALGERITRNVQNLMRREIRKALLSKPAE